MEDDWEVVRKDRGWSMGEAGIGILRIALLFGSAAVALAMILTPIVDRQTRNYAAQGGSLFGVDDMTTGSIRSPGSVYTIRKSVLQSSPDAVCVIRHDGRRQGDC